MIAQILGIFGSVLLIIIGWWKYTKGKEAAEKKRKDDAAKKINDGVDSGNTSDITIGMDRLNR